MTTRTYGILAGVLGSALGMWWWNRQRWAIARMDSGETRDRGTVIFDNTPTASEV